MSGRPKARLIPEGVVQLRDASSNFLGDGGLTLNSFPSVSPSDYDSSLSACVEACVRGSASKIEARNDALITIQVKYHLSRTDSVPGSLINCVYELPNSRGNLPSPGEMK